MNGICNEIKTRIPTDLKQDPRAVRQISDCLSSSVAIAFSSRRQFFSPIKARKHGNAEIGAIFTNEPDERPIVLPCKFSAI